MFSLVNKNNLFVRVVIALGIVSLLLTPILADATGTGNSKPKGVVNCDGPVAGRDGGVCNFKAFVKIINDLITLVIQVAAVFAAILFAWAGWLMLSSEGKPDKITQAKKVIWAVIVGFLIILLAWLIVNVILGTLLKEGGEARSVLQGIFGNFTKL